MIEPRKRAGLALESPCERGVIRERRRKDLDGDRPIEPQVAGGVDLAHPSRANQAGHFVGPEARAGRKRHVEGLYLRPKRPVVFVTVAIIAPWTSRSCRRSPAASW